MSWLTDRCHKERVINCQQAPWPEDDVTPLRPLYEAPDFDKSVLTFIKVSCFIQMYTEILGVLHHLLARGPADNL